MEGSGLDGIQEHASKGGGARHHSHLRQRLQDGDGVAQRLAGGCAGGNHGVPALQAQPGQCVQSDREGLAVCRGRGASPPCIWREGWALACSRESTVAAWCVKMRPTPRSCRAAATAGASGVAGVACCACRAAICSSCTAWPWYQGSAFKCSRNRAGPNCSERRGRRRHRRTRLAPAVTRPCSSLCAHRDGIVSAHANSH